MKSINQGKLIVTKPSRTKSVKVEDWLKAFGTEEDKLAWAKYQKWEKEHGRRILRLAYAKYCRDNEP